MWHILNDLVEYISVLFVAKCMYKILTWRPETFSKQKYDVVAFEYFNELITLAVTRPYLLLYDFSFCVLLLTYYLLRRGCFPS